MKNFPLYLRTVVFGVIDSLVSTVGLLAGMDAAGAPRETIVLAGIIYAFVEAFSMAVGNFLSEESAEEYQSRSDVPEGPSVSAGVIMFASSVLAAFIPLAPYLLWDSWFVFPVSVGISVVALFVVGMISASLARLPVLWRGARMALLGGAAIVLGVLIGLILPVA